MEEKNDADKNDDVMLPGFRFHPTDEELVGFYLKRKIQQRTLPIELIKQVDIYKYDPWDLPKLATTGEKEWYFYCPRDRKYRNSARPNRVTGAGFWKATGTDRPIYSSDGTKCIGLKKSLVFYRGRAARGIKTDWMMHEFRLPSLGEPTPPKKVLDKSLPANDAWAICRIFKKTNSMTQRTLSQSWFSTLQDTASPDMLNQAAHCTPFSSENISCTTEISSFQTCSVNDLLQQQQPSFPGLDIPGYKPICSTVDKPSLFVPSNGDLPNFLFSPIELSGLTKCSVAPSMVLNPAIIDISKASESMDSGVPQHQLSGFSLSFPHNIQGHTCIGEDEAVLRKNQSEIHENSQWGAVRPLGFPFSLPSNLPDAWKSDLSWDSPPCPSEMSTTYSTNKCYT
ncbi:hypothetical protein K2173_014277 [Erythroxylum novogranatense]|uniref:NAC domain-containing protein n=1 Tax=Erythroxylum novogranatense TaxID=1862640 RepID=A0AAV8SDY3_9ROSI|nr:hypothetical protein K2173_014277 [Erythroxylum novogranatense]